MASGKVRIEPLDVGNYHTWSIRMKFYLIHKKLWKGVEDPDSDADLTQEALSTIGLNVANHHLGMIGGCRNAKEAWDKLEEIYRSKGNARKLMLRKELNGLRWKHEEPMAKYVARAKDLWDELTATGFEMKEEEVAWNLLVGLPKDYESLVSHLENQSESLTLDELLPRLLQTEARLGSSVSSQRDEGEAVAYAAQKSGRVLEYEYARLDHR